jgi:acyl-coenzyme A thioesterase PaaI-like protein
VTTETLSQRFDHDHCLFCGSANPDSLGLAFSIDGPGAVRGHVDPDEHLQGYTGILHGGIVAALLDAAMTHCLFMQDVQAVTADLRVRYVDPVPCRGRLELTARLVDGSRRVYRLRAELQREGRVLAWAEAKFLRQREGA